MPPQLPDATITSILQSSEPTNQPSSSASYSDIHAPSILPSSIVLDHNALQNQGGWELPDLDFDVEDDDLAFLVEDFDLNAPVNNPLIALNGVVDMNIRIQGINILMEVLLLANKSAMNGTFDSQMCAAALSEIGVPYLQPGAPFPSRDAGEPSGQKGVCMFAATSLKKPVHINGTGSSVPVVACDHREIHDGAWVIFQQYGVRCEQGNHTFDNKNSCAGHARSGVTRYHLAKKGKPPEGLQSFQPYPSGVKRSFSFYSVVKTSPVMIVEWSASEPPRGTPVQAFARTVQATSAKETLASKSTMRNSAITPQTQYYVQPSNYQPPGIQQQPWQQTQHTFQHERQTLPHENVIQQQQQYIKAVQASQQQREIDHHLHTCQQQTLAVQQQQNASLINLQQHHLKQQQEQQQQQQQAHDVHDHHAPLQQHANHPIASQWGLLQQNIPVDVQPQVSCSWEETGPPAQQPNTSGFTYPDDADLARIYLNPQFGINPSGPQTLLRTLLPQQGGNIRQPSESSGSSQRLDLSRTQYGNQAANSFRHPVDHSLAEDPCRDMVSLQLIADDRSSTQKTGVLSNNSGHSELFADVVASRASQLDITVEDVWTSSQPSKSSTAVRDVGSNILHIPTEIPDNRKLSGGVDVGIKETSSGLVAKPARTRKPSSRKRMGDLTNLNASTSYDISIEEIPGCTSGSGSISGSGSGSATITANMSRPVAETPVEQSTTERLAAFGIHERSDNEQDNETKGAIGQESRFRIEDENTLRLQKFMSSLAKAAKYLDVNKFHELLSEIDASEVMNLHLVGTGGYNLLHVLCTPPHCLLDMKANNMDPGLSPAGMAVAQMADICLHHFGIEIFHKLLEQNSTSKGHSTPVIKAMRYGRPEVLDFVLKNSTLKALLTPTTQKWVGCHSAAESANCLSFDLTLKNEHLLSIDMWIDCIERLIPEAYLREHAVIGAYDVMCKCFSDASTAILRQVFEKRGYGFTNGIQPNAANTVTYDLEKLQYLNQIVMDQSAALRIEVKRNAHTRSESNKNKQGQSLNLTSMEGIDKETLLANTAQKQLLLQRTLLELGHRQATGDMNLQPMDLDLQYNNQSDFDPRDYLRNLMQTRPMVLLMSWNEKIDKATESAQTQGIIAALLCLNGIGLSDQFVPETCKVMACSLGLKYLQNTPHPTGREGLEYGDEGVCLYAASGMTDAMIKVTSFVPLPKDLSKVKLGSWVLGRQLGMRCDSQMDDGLHFLDPRTCHNHPRSRETRYFLLSKNGLLPEATRPLLHPKAKDCNMDLYEYLERTPVSIYQWELSILPKKAGSSATLDESKGN